jgi:uncharacterized SAM-binding protein YcdF (DUF218 family)
VADVTAPRWGGRLLALALLSILIVAAWQFRAGLLRSAAELWIVSDPLEAADAIVILGGGIDTRPFAAAEYYKRGLAPQILIADVRISPVERLEILPRHGELNREVLLKLGVPPEVILTFGREVRNTYEEMRGLLDWIEQGGAKSVIVPTDMFTARRVRWLFGRELEPKGVTLSVQSLPPLEYGVNDWWHQEQGIVAFQNEVLKYLYYRMKY